MKKTPEYTKRAIKQHRQKFLESGGAVLSLRMKPDQVQRVERLAELHPVNGSPSKTAAINEAIRLYYQARMGH